MDLIKRKQMTDHLVARLPYRREWFAKLTGDKLTALYLKHRQTPRLTKQEAAGEYIEDHIIIHEDPEVRINQDTNEREIMSDSGEWVQIYE